MPAVTTNTPGYGLSVADIAIRVKRIFGDEAGVEIDDNDILRWVNDGQLDIVRRTECIQRTSEISAGVNVSSYPVPFDFLFFKRATFDGRLLSSIPFQTLDSLYPHRQSEAATGSPEYITVSGATFLLYPAPDVTGATNIDLTYVARPILVSAVSDTPEIPIAFHEALVRFCLMRAKELNEDWAAATQIRESYDTMIVGARHDTQTQSSDHYPVVIDYDGDY